MDKRTKKPTTSSAADPVIERLIELEVPAKLAAEVKTLGVEKLDDLASLTEADLVSIGMPSLKARQLVAKLKPTSNAAGTVSFDGILPNVPNEESWLTALRIGGVLKVDQSTVISAVRATLAHRAGLFTIPEKLVLLMEDFSDENEDQVPTEFYKIRKEITRQTYGDLFEAIPGMDSAYVTRERKERLFKRIDTHLWPSIRNFNDQLKAWQDDWMKGAANPAMMMSIFMASVSGKESLPVSMIQPPDTGTLRDYAATMTDSINKVFSGTGVQISATVAYNASKIKETLENPQLPALTGAANHDQLLKKLGVGVPAAYTRMETNLTKFVLGIMEMEKQPAGQEEIRYIGALYMLGSQIPWDQLVNRCSPQKTPPS